MTHMDAADEYLSEWLGTQQIGELFLLESDLFEPTSEEYGGFFKWVKENNIVLTDGIEELRMEVLGE